MGVLLLGTKISNLIFENNININDVKLGFKYKNSALLIQKNYRGYKIRKILRVEYIKKSRIINSPGLLRKHYSPGIPIKLNQKVCKIGAAFITFGNKYKDSKNYFNLSKKGDLKEAAANLYKIMRKIKKKGYKKIFVSRIPNFGAGIAINDRLLRASR